MKAQLALIFLTFSFSSIATSSATKPHKEQTQQDFISKIKKAPLKVTRRMKMYRKSGTLSTTFANSTFGVKRKLKRWGFKKTTITTKEGYKNKIYLRMSKRPKPTLVFVGGLGSQVTSSSLLPFAKAFRHTSRYHVVLIESSSNPNWIVRNKAFAFSGYEAGWNLYLVLTRLKELYPIKSIHASGISLGGSDIVFSTYFDSILNTNLLENGVISWSGPIGRLHSLDDLRTKKGFGRIIGKSMMKKIVKGSLPFLRSYTDKPVKWITSKATFEELYQQIYAPIAQKYFKAHPHHFKHMLPYKDVDAFSEVGPYMSMFLLNPYLPKMKHPILWINAEDDAIVDFKINKEYSDSLELHDNMALWNTKFGGHVGYSKTHGTKWIRKVINRYNRYWSASLNK